MPTFTPQAQIGLDYLKKINPALADSISKGYAPGNASPINASLIGNSPSLAIPAPKSAPLPDYANFAVSTPQIVNTARQDALEAEQSTLVRDINATNAKLGTKSARQSELETAQGIPGLNSQLNELNNQIRSIQSEALRATNTSEDRLAPSFAIRGEQAAIERQRAVRVYGLSAAAEAIQGNIALANDNVSRALDAEFGGLEQEIENKKFLLQLNMDNFDKEEKRRAEAQQIALDQEKERVAQLRQDRQSILDIMLTAAQQGADNLTLNRIQTAASPEDAIAKAGKTLGAEFEARMQQQRFENNLALRNVALDEARFAYQKWADQASRAGNVITAQTANGLTSVLSNNKIGQSAKTSVGTILGVINAAEDLAKARPDGKFTGFYPGAKLVDFFLPDAVKKSSTIENEGYLNAINLKVQQWASGATLTESQTRLVEGMVPKKNDSDAKIKAKLNNLTNFMQQQIKGTLAAEGITYDPIRVDLWASNKSLADIFNK